MLWPLPVKNMLGVGKNTANKLQALGIQTIGQIAKTDRSLLVRIFGKMGGEMHDLANGIDHRAVENVRQAKSCGRETTFAVDIDDRRILEDTLSVLADDVAHTLRRDNLKCKGVSLKFRYANLKRASRACLLSEYTSAYKDIYQALMEMLEKYWHGEPLRLIGLSATHLKENPPIQQEMFTSEQKIKQEKLDQTLDSLNDRYGKNTLKRARHMNEKNGHFE